MSVFPPPRFRSRIAGALLALASLSLLSACASDDGAFVDRRRDATYPTLTYVGRSTLDAPSICYNSWLTTPERVLGLARAVCAESGRVAVLTEQTFFDCRILYPSRADFRCVDPGEVPLWDLRR